MSYFAATSCDCGASAGEACVDENGIAMLGTFHASRRFNLIEIVNREIEIIAEDVLLKDRSDGH